MSEDVRNLKLEYIPALTVEDRSTLGGHGIFSAQELYALLSSSGGNEAFCKLMGLSEDKLIELRGQLELLLGPWQCRELEKKEDLTDRLGAILQDED